MKNRHVIFTVSLAACSAHREQPVGLSSQPAYAADDEQASGGEGDPLLKGYAGFPAIPDDPGCWNLIPGPLLPAVFPDLVADECLSQDAAALAHPDKPHHY